MANEQTAIAKGWRRIVYIILGFVFLGLAALGTGLPVLPTTPFLLLASACFIRSSPALNERLLRSRLFGPFLRDWQRYRGVRLHVKVTAVTVIVGAVAASISFGDLSLPLLVVLVALAGVGLIVVLRLPVVRESAIAQGSPRSRLDDGSHHEVPVACDRTSPHRQRPAVENRCGSQ